MAGDSPADERHKRLLVLGAGPAQLGLLEAARGRGLEVIALDRDPAAPGFRLADKRALVSVEDEPAIERLALAERVDGVIAPGIDWPVGIAARLARAARPPASDLARDRGARDLEAAPARALRRGGRAAAALAGLPGPRRGDGGGRGARLPLRREGARPAGPEGARARPARRRSFPPPSSSRSRPHAARSASSRRPCPGRR